MKNEMLRWPVRFNRCEYELVVFECGTSAIFNRTSYLQAHPDPASRLFGMIMDSSEMVSDHLVLTGMVYPDVYELCRELALRKPANPSRVESNWMDQKCLEFVAAAWQRMLLPEPDAQPHTQPPQPQPAPVPQ